MFAIFVVLGIYYLLYETAFCEYADSLALGAVVDKRGKSPAEEYG